VPQPTRPEDILPDGEDFKTIRGVRVRKGTIAAAMSNMEVLANGSEEERHKARAVIEELAPALVVLGVHRHFQCRNPEVESILATSARLLGDGGKSA